MPNPFSSNSPGRGGSPFSGGTAGAGETPAWGRYGGGGDVLGPDPEQTYAWEPYDRSAYDKWQQQQVGAAGSWLQRLQSGKGSYGEAILGQAQQRASQAMASQAVSRGANPSSERAAIMAGGQMAAQGAVTAAQARAQEMAMAHQQQIDAFNQQRMGELEWGRLDAAQQQAAAQHYAQMTGLEMDEDIQFMRGIGAIFGGGAAAGQAMASGEDLKQAATLISPQAQDELAQAMAMTGVPQRLSASQHVPTLEDRALGASQQQYLNYLAEPQLTQPLGQVPLQQTGRGIPLQKLGPQDLAQRAVLSQAAEESAAQRYINALLAAGQTTEAQLGGTAQTPTGSALPAGMYEQEQPMISGEDLKGAIRAASPAAQDEIMANLWAITPGSGKLEEREEAAKLARRWQSYYPPLSASDRAQMNKAVLGHAALPVRQGRNTLGEIAYDAQMHARRMRPGGEADQDKLARSLKLKSFEYRPQALAVGAPAGQRFGIMAEQMESSPLGTPAVVQIPGLGKGLDRDQLLGISMGLHGRAAERDEELKERLRRIEKRR